MGSHPTAEVKSTYEHCSQTQLTEREAFQDDPMDIPQLSPLQHERKLTPPQGSLKIPPSLAREAGSASSRKPSVTSLAGAHHQHTSDPPSQCMALIFTHCCWLVWP
jgi:hypothetical protein